MTLLPPDARFVLTGPSGWIGNAMLAHLARRSGTPLAGRVIAFASANRTLTLPSGERLAVRSLDTITAADVAGAHVIHLAYLTKEKADELGERYFTDTNLGIDDAVLAALREGGAASVFVASSGAAKLAATSADLHPYGVAKLRQEARFLEWGKAASVPVIAGRIFNIAGPHINKPEAYAMANFAVQALEAGRIAIKAAVPVFRSFLHVDDLCALVVNAALHRINRVRPIDLCGSEVVEMADLAAAVAALTGSPPIERGRIDHARPSAYLGDFVDTKCLAMELGVELAPFWQQIRDTVRWIASTRDQEAVA